MIGKIYGEIEGYYQGQGYVKTSGGISYLCYLVPSLQGRIGQKVAIYTYLAVREDSLTLYGFEHEAEHQLFTKIIAIDGVGPKLAFGIISFATVEAIIFSVKEQDVDFFVSIPGVGRKTAQRILLELSSKLGTDYDFGRTALSQEDQTVIAALETLGFRRKESEPVLVKLEKKLSLEEKIRASIKQLTEKKV